MNIEDGIFYIIVLLISMVLHEVAHGFVADNEGDQTAKLSGRLTMNPIKHLELFGSIILPLVLVLSNAPFVVGWAKPVPVNPYNFKHGRKSIIKVSLAGIFVNLLLAVVFSVFIRASIIFGFANERLISASATIVIVNLVLALFNAIPIPPLDGSKVLFELLPQKFFSIQKFLQQNQLLVLITFIVFVWPYIAPFILRLVFGILTGISL